MDQPDVCGSDGFAVDVSGDDRHGFGSGDLRAVVRAQGAELCSLRQAGRQVIWQAGPVWPRHAPVLFPIVGRLRDDRLQVDGTGYAMGQHGFARDSRFQWLDRTPDGCRLLLTDSRATRAQYPFAFRLELAFTLADGALRVDHLLSNPGEATLPASLGAHPAFCWPLIAGVAKADHMIRFQHDEPAPIRRLVAGLMQPAPVATPIRDGRLNLTEDLFAADAIILDAPASRWARLAVPDGRGVQVDWSGFAQLGIWSKPGDFVCIEPWFGFASPVAFDGDFRTKPGLALIPPGAARRFGYRITPQLER